MSNTISQSRTLVTSGNVTSFTASYGACSNPSLLCVFVQENGSTTITPSCTDSAGNTYASDESTTAATAGGLYAFSAQNTSTSSVVVTVTNSSANFSTAKLYELTGAATSSAKDSSAKQNGVSVTLTVTTITDHCTILAYDACFNTLSGAVDTGYNLDTNNVSFGNNFHSCESKADVGTAGGNTLTWNGAANRSYQTFVAVAYKTAASGIVFDAASNSGDQVGSSSYTFNRTVSGVNRFLAVDVAVLSAGASVTSIVDDSAGGAVPLTFIGKRATVTSLGTIESWGLVAPVTGTKSIQVNLSASIESVGCAVSYTGVHQTVPTEAYNSAQATNAGSATDASVVVTSIADNCWIHAGLITNDLSVTAGQTSRNNVAGTLGTGANEDNNAAVTPAGNTTMSYTGEGITATWAIGGYAIRPIAASSGVSIPALAAQRQFIGVGVF